MRQEQAPRTYPRREDENFDYVDEKGTTKTESPAVEEHKDILDEIDKVIEESSTDISDLMDEIDKLLEPNAEEYAEKYVQKGGQ